MSSKLQEFTFIIPSGDGSASVSWAVMYAALEAENLIEEFAGEVFGDELRRRAEEEKDGVEPLVLRVGVHDELKVYSLTMRESIAKDEVAATKHAQGDENKIVLGKIERCLIAFNRNPYPKDTAAFDAWGHPEVPIDRATFRLENQVIRTFTLVQDAYSEINLVSAGERKRFRQAIGVSG